MKEHLLYNFEDKAILSLFGFVIDPIIPLVLGIGFLLGSVTTYFLMKTKYEK